MGALAFGEWEGLADGRLEVAVIDEGGKAVQFGLVGVSMFQIGCPVSRGAARPAPARCLCAAANGRRVPRALHTWQATAQ